MPDVGSTAGSAVRIEPVTDQVNDARKTKSWYARLSGEDKAKYLMKLRMSRLQKKAAHPCTPTLISNGNKNDYMCAFHVQMHVTNFLFIIYI